MSSTYSLNKNKLEFFLISCIALTGPMVFLSLRPFLNFYLVDIFIIIYVLYCCFTLRNRSVRPSVIISIFMIIFGYTLSGMFSDYPEYYAASITQYGLVFLLIIALSSTKVSTYEISKIIKLYILGMSISILISYLIYFNIITLFESNYYVAGRFKGIWGNPNSVAKEMIMYIIVLMSIIFLSSIKFKKVLTYLGLSLLAVYLILTTASFGGLLFLFFGFLILVSIAAFHNSLLGNIKYLIYILLSIIALMFTIHIYSEEIIPLIPERFITRILETESLSTAGSGADKLEHITAGFKLFVSSPLIGTGIESGKHYNSTVDPVTGIPVGFHSFYITAMVEGGILVILGFIGLFLDFIRNCYRSESEYRNIFLAIVLIFLSNLIINNNIFSRYIWFPAIFVALSINDNKFKNSRNL